jgi:hypothetical protein
VKKAPQQPVAVLLCALHDLEQQQQQLQALAQLEGCQPTDFVSVKLEQQQLAQQQPQPSALEQQLQLQGAVPQQQQQGQQQQQQQQQQKQENQPQQQPEHQQQQDHQQYPMGLPQSTASALAHCQAQVTVQQVPGGPPDNRQQWQEWSKLWPMPWRSPAGAYD